MNESESIMMAIFKAGFKAGQSEQHDRDFPDAGFRPDKGVNEYWEDFTKRKGYFKEDENGA